MIKSVYEKQEDILNAIKELYLNGKEYECDITYGNGVFWKHITAPKLKYDITPLKKGVIKADSKKSPINDDSLDNIIFDPPFLTYIRDGRKHGSIMGERFGGYWNYRELETHYRRTLMEIRRVLSINSILIMKCQDIIHNHKMHCTHHNVINWAEQLNFELIDLFILVAKNRIINKTFKGTTRIQKHSRIFHSYFLVFKKKQ